MILYQMFAFVVVVMMQIATIFCHNRLQPKQQSFTTTIFTTTNFATIFYYNNLQQQP